MNLVSFVILHYGDWTVTDRCVQSILEMRQRERIRIVIVDNDIRRKTEERDPWKRRYEAFSGVKVLQIEENGGFSYANNAGYRYARNIQKASFIVVVNNDVIFVQQTFIEHLESLYERYPCSVIGPDIIRSGTGEHQNPLDDRLRTIWEARRTIGFNRLALAAFPLLYPLLSIKGRREEKRNTEKRRTDRRYYSEIHENIVPFGALLVFTPEYIRQEEAAFWPETGFYYEEYLLACRCGRKGYRIMYLPELVAVHKGSASIEAAAENRKSKMKFQMSQIAASARIYLNYRKQTKWE